MRSALFLLMLCSLGCAQDPEVEPVRLEEREPFRASDFFDISVPDEGEVDSSHVQPEPDMEVSVDMPAPHAQRGWIVRSDFEQLPMPPELVAEWSNSAAPCSSDVETASIGTEFRLPEPDERRPGAFTAQEFVDILGVGSRKGLSGVIPDPSLRYLPLPGGGSPSHGYILEGEDVILRLFDGNVTNLYDFEDVPFLGFVTVMVNYEPVEATYRRWNPERTEVVQESTGPALNFEVGFPLEMIDVVIPAESFVRGTQELSIFMQAGPANSIPSSFWRRIHVHKEAIVPMEFPCFQLPLDEVGDNVIEQALFAQGAQNKFAIALMPENMRNHDALFRTEKPILTEPGETIRLFATMPRNGSNPDDLTYFAAMLFMNDEPLWDEAAFFSSRPVPRISKAGDPKTIDWRGVFEVTLPKEPGIHSIRIASWADPFTVAVMPDGSDVVPYRAIGITDNGSNILTFLVREGD